jgi:hypothetical protein
VKLSDEELALYAIREAQLILADYILPGPRDCEKTINALLSVLDRDDVVEAVDRLEPAPECARLRISPPRLGTRIITSDL